MENQNNSNDDENTDTKRCPVKIFGYCLAKQMKRNVSVLFIGPANSGKTASIRHIAHEMKFKRALVVTGSVKHQQFHQQYVPHENVVHGWKIEEQSKVDALINKSVNDVEEAAVIFDSLGHDDNVMNCQQLKNLLHDSYILNTWVGISIQYNTQLPKPLRGLVDVVFIFGAKSKHDRMSLYNQYGSMFFSFEKFNDFFDACTKDGGAMVIDTTVDSDDLTDMVFWYKPKHDLPRFVIGKDDDLKTDKDSHHHVDVNTKGIHSEINNDNKPWSKAWPLCSLNTNFNKIFSFLGHCM